VSVSLCCFAQSFSSLPGGLTHRQHSHLVSHITTGQEYHKSPNWTGQYVESSLVSFRYRVHVSRKTSPNFRHESLRIHRFCFSSNRLGSFPERQPLPNRRSRRRLHIHGRWTLVRESFSAHILIKQCFSSTSSPSPKCRQWPPGRHNQYQH